MEVWLSRSETTESINPDFKKKLDMEINVLGQFLRRLCKNSDWKYAVFWKRQYHQNQTMLIWEDGYCDSLKPRKLAENVSGNDFFNHAQGNFSSGCGISTHTSNGCPVEQALSDMVYVRYVMGEGVVGEVAYLGTHCWTSCEDILAGQHSVHIPEFSNDWVPQIEAGVKTILLVAVAPYGVLQLGSLEVVTEDMDLLNRIRKEFTAIQNHFPIFCSSNRNTVAQTSSSLESILLDNADVSTGVTGDDIIDDNAALPISVTPNIGIVVPRFSTEDLVQESEEALLDSLLDLYRDDIEIPLLSPNDMKEQELETYPQHNNSCIGICNDLSTGNINSYIIEDMEENLYGADDDGAGRATTSNIFGIPSTYELWEALGSDLLQQTIVDNWETSIPYTGVFNGDTELLVGEASEWYSQNSDVKDLFGAVVASACSGIDKTLLNRNDSIKLMSVESEEPFSIVSSCELRFDNSAFCEDLWSQVASVGAPRSKGSSSKFSATSTAEPMLGKLINYHSPNEGYGDMKPSGESKPILRKTGDKPVDKQKRRPRDRQLIQDRLKVLRDLVPNGEKFSIDGLLDRTIKHMTFLRKVSDQSKKLRAYEEADGEINLKSSVRKDNWKSGGSWACQAGSEQDVFPIVVEHLHIPGHMLIEMLCNEHDLFLEVAQVICGLDLTIVKGGMKTQSNSSWAQFVVEVHKGFQRMDVFWPLMQLLQRKPKPVST